MNFCTSLNVQYLCQDLLSKLGAQVTFPPHGRPTVQVGSTAYLLFLSVTPQDEWRLHYLPARKPDGLNSQERELTQQFPEVWAEDNPPPYYPYPPPQVSKTGPTGNRTQTLYNYISTCLGPVRPCLAVYSLCD